MMATRVNFSKPSRKVTKVFIHCSASDNPKHDNVETIDRWHKERGWAGIGYHYYIDKLGQRFIGRDIEKIPAAQKGHNTGSIAICLGGLNDFSELQIGSLRVMLKQINTAYNGNVTFHGHREVENSKSCPNFSYKELLNLNDKGQLL